MSDVNEALDKLVKKRALADEVMIAIAFALGYESITLEREASLGPPHTYHTGGLPVSANVKKEVEYVIDRFILEYQSAKYESPKEGTE